MPFPDAAAYQWYEAHTQQIIARCHREVPAMVAVAQGPLHLWLPGGDGKYGSFFPRDFVMQCRSGFIPRPAMEAALKLILLHQNGPDRRDLAHGLHINPWSVPDHINLLGLREATTDGVGAVFFPGTNSPGNDQGTGRYGTRGTDDNVYEVIELTRLLNADRALLQCEINGVTVFDRLHRAFHAAIVHPETGLCWNRKDDWAAANFHDGLGPQGYIALTSILRFRGAQTMRDFCRLLGDEKNATEYERIASKISASLITHLQQPSGWLNAATEVNRQADTWSTAMAVYYDVLQGEPRRRACTALRQALRDGSVSRFGYLRHAPAFADAVPGQQVWEDRLAGEPWGMYQNGGYWPTPLGYYVYGVAEVDREAARQLATEFIDHTRSRAEAGAPGATAGNYGISLSWGVAGVHSSSAKYILDLDGNFATTGDQTTFTMDQTKDATGATVGDGSWSGFKSIGTFALTANSKIMVTNNAAGSYLTLDEFLLAPQDTVAVPEPSTLFLLGVGGLVAYRMIRNRRR